MVLGSFFLGYCIMTFPMGMVVQRWGGKIPLQIALFVNGVASLLAPWVIHWVRMYEIDCECLNSIKTIVLQVCFEATVTATVAAG